MAKSKNEINYHNESARSIQVNTHASNLQKSNVKNVFQNGKYALIDVFGNVIATIFGFSGITELKSKQDTFFSIS